MKRRFLSLMAILMVMTMLAACVGASPQAPVERTVVVTTVLEKKVQVTTVVETTVEVAKVVTATPLPEAKSIRINLGTYPDVVDPQQSSYANEVAHLQLVYEGLTKLNENLETVPGAAESWEYNEDATQVVFTLPADATYSDGEPLTAANFEYALKRNCDPNVAGQYQSITFEIVGCEEYATADVGTATEEELQALRDAVGVKASEDGTTLTIDLKKPAPYFHTVLSLWVAYPVRQDLVEEGGDLWWNGTKFQIGNGPFIWQTLEPQVKSVFVPNPNYRGDVSKVNIEYAYITDSAVAFEAYRNNEFDIIALAAEDLATAQEDAELNEQILQYPGSCTTNIMFNHTMAPFDNKEVRQAFSMALDRESWAKDVDSGLSLPTQTWIPPGFPGHDAEEKSWSFDPEAAKAKLAEAGFEDLSKLPEIKLTYGSSPRNKVRTEWIANQLQTNLGLTNVVLDPVEPTTYTALTKDVSTNPAMSRGGWCSDYPDPQNWLSVYWRTGTFADRYGYSNPEFDALVDQADTTVDPAKRMELYAEAQQLLIQDAPAVFMYNATNTYLVKPWVTGIVTTPQDSNWPGAQKPSTIDVDEAAKVAAQ